MCEYQYLIQAVDIWFQNMFSSQLMLFLEGSLTVMSWTCPFVPEKEDILLMEEILHHLGFIKPCKSWDKLPVNWCSIASINSTIATLDSQNFTFLTSAPCQTNISKTSSDMPAIHKEDRNEKPMNFSKCLRDVCIYVNYICIDFIPYGSK